MRPLTQRGQELAERRFEIDRCLLDIMGLVVAEWQSDPQSARCFDLRIVEEAKKLWEERKHCPLPFQSQNPPEALEALKRQS